MDKQGVIKQLIKRSNRTTVQTLVKTFNVEQLGYLYADIIEDNFNVKKGTSSFGIAVSELFSDYKVNKVRLAELDLIIKKSLSKYKLHYSIDVKRDQMAIHNNAVEEFRILNKNNERFVRLANKIFKEFLK